MMHKEESADDCAYLDENELEQILGTRNPCEDSPPLNISNRDNVKLLEEPADLSDDAQKVLVGMGENHCGPEHHDDLEYYLQFYNATDDIAPFLTTNPSEITGSKGFLPDPEFFCNDYLNDATQQVDMSKQHLFDANGHDVASSSLSKQEMESQSTETMCYKGASRILGNINAPPAFASEFPTKAAMLCLNSAAPQSSSIQTRNISLSNNGIDFSFSKHGHVNIILSFGLSQGNINSLATQQIKAATDSLVSRGWICFLFIWVMLFSFIFKFGSYICAR